MSNLFLSIIISLAQASNGAAPATVDASSFSTTRVVATPLSAEVWIDQTNRAIRSGECYEAVKAVTCEIPDLMIQTFNWRTTEQYYRGLIDCRDVDTVYLITDPEHADEILPRGDLFCRDANSVYVSMPALPETE